LFYTEFVDTFMIVSMFRSL